jgi:hypothetical protein
VTPPPTSEEGGLPARAGRAGRAPGEANNWSSVELVVEKRFCRNSASVSMAREDKMKELCPVFHVRNAGKRCNGE